MPSRAPRSERVPPPRPRESPAPLRRLEIGAAVALAVLLVDLRLGGSDVLRALELQTLDWRFRWRGPIAPGPETALVLIDDRSLAQLGSWPVPRGVIAAAVRRLTEVGARVIALDLLLTEAQRPIPAEIRSLLADLAATLPTGARELRRRIEAVLAAGDPDLELALAIQAADRVVTP